MLALQTCSGLSPSALLYEELVPGFQQLCFNNMLWGLFHPPSSSLPIPHPVALFILRTFFENLAKTFFHMRLQSILILKHLLIGIVFNLCINLGRIDSYLIFYLTD